MAKKKSKDLLTNLELEVMRAVWAAPEAKSLRVRDVVEQLNADREKALAYNTVQTILTILKDKGYVRAQPGPGRAHVYSARISQEASNSSMVDDLVTRLYDGQVEPLLVRLVEDEALGREQLEALKRFIDRKLDDEEPQS